MVAKVSQGVESIDGGPQLLVALSSSSGRVAKAGKNESMR